MLAKNRNQNIKQDMVTLLALIAGVVDLLIFVLSGTYFAGRCRKQILFNDRLHRWSQPKHWSK